MPALKDVEQPVAIAMWYVSWLWRRYPGGGFEDWDRALDELEERGYNAVRIDAFPHLVARDRDGRSVDVFHVPAYLSEYPWPIWRNQQPIDINHREALVEFVSKCRDRGIYVALSSWMHDAEPGRCEQVEGVAGLVGIWDETLTLLADNDCLGPVIFVDMLNEYPLWHGMEWLRKELRALGALGRPELDSSCRYSPEQKAFYRTFISDVLGELKAKWPALDFCTSQTQNYWGKEEMDMDYSNFDLLDVHCWIVQHNEFTDDTGYFEHIHRRREDTHWAESCQKMIAKWAANRDAYADWLDGKMEEMAAVAGQWKLPLANTEGWGPIMWTEHAALDWGWVRESAEIVAALGAKHGYAINCTSNFCMPNFPGMWADADWHRQVTAVIRGGQKR
ncbi:MAG: cellulase-like family protein [Lentisphaeria bacterium]|nr:cellulase-like family protein [Lentisphaeria bacterium]